MKLLQWISFGTWNDQSITQDDYNFVKIMFIIFTVFVVLKIIFMFFMDCDNLKKGSMVRWFLFSARILQGMLYMFLFCIMGFFQTPNLYFIVITFGIYNIILAIIVILGDLKKNYIYGINQKIRNLCETTSKNIQDNWDIKKQCKKLNKKINDYQKTAIIR